MLRELRPAIVLLALLTIVTGLAYPIALTGISQVLFPSQANGSQVEVGGKIVGSALIGQNFTDAKYFHGRPSATSDTDPKDPTKTVPAPYNAMNSAGSNLGPTSQALSDRVKADIATLQAENPGVPVPADLVTTSASGLDPDISPEAAAFQAPRISKERKLPLATVQSLIQQQTKGRLFGLLGEPRLNVLALNIALDTQR